MIRGDFLDSGASLSGPVVPCETVFKDYKLNEGELAVPGLPLFWWAVAVKAATAQVCDDNQNESSSCAEAIGSGKEASILGKCQTEKEKGENDPILCRQGKWV